MASFVRGKVSKSKRRYRQDGFDLDLSYITKNIIAMGFPSEGLEAKYRNPYSEVIRFLDSHHKGHFKVYNLCSERVYEPSKFYNRVGHFPFDDHNAPPFELIEEFCNDVHQYLSQDSENVAVVHCKAGKGRTGTMICAYLLYCHEWDNADEVMNFYAAMRTYNKKGVTIPSQITYIRYFDRYLKDGMPRVETLLLNYITLHGIPHFQGELRVRVTGFTKQDYFASKFNLRKKKGYDDQNESISVDCGPTPISGDIKIEFTEKSFSGSIAPAFHFWFNTAFIARDFKEAPFIYSVSQQLIDKANKDKNHKVFPKGFRVSLEFQYADQPEKSTSLSIKFAKRQSNATEEPDSILCPEASPPTTYSKIMASYPSLNNL